MFRYLSDHPSVCGSKVKETSFFEKLNELDNTEDKLKKYLAYFPSCSSDKRILLEASSGYLAGGAKIVQQIESLLDNPAYLILLRNPIERLYSYFNFHVGQLSIPTEVSFEDFIEMSVEYSTGQTGNTIWPFPHRHLLALQHGCYSFYIKDYLDVIQKDRLLIVFFDDIVHDINSAMKKICNFLHIDHKFYNDYSFKRVNSTFSAKNVFLHKIAMHVNCQLEQFTRQKPYLKDKIVMLYKFINKKKEKNDRISSSAKQKMREYYSKSLIDLQNIIQEDIPDTWT
jgi:hypothetical protein